MAVSSASAWRTATDILPQKHFNPAIPATISASRCISTCYR